MVTAEEQGLLGSQYYSVTPIYPLAKTVANINIDGVNQWGRTKDITVIGMGASDLDDYLREAATQQGRTLRPDPESEKGLLLPLRPLQLREAGSSGALHRHRRRVHRQTAEYSKQKRDEYTDKDYHAPSDEVKPDWDLVGRGRGRAAALHRRLSRRERGQVPRMEAGERVQGQERGDAEAIVHWRLTIAD